MEKGKLTGTERRLLLKIARQAVETELSGLPFSLPRVTNPNLLEHRGAFVTIHRHGQLRGCIETFSANRPLYEGRSVLWLLERSKNTSHNLQC
jgi:AMMECR1 domain-containing protein